MIHITSLKGANISWHKNYTLTSVDLFREWRLNLNLIFKFWSENISLELDLGNASERKKRISQGLH